MTKEKETRSKDEMYSGKTEGLTFEKFDDLVISWCREKYGDKYAHALWKDELMKIGSLDLTDDLDRYGFETYCEWMFDILSLESPRYAAELWRSDRFWTKKWQLEQRQRQREKLFCHLEKLTYGEAKRQLVKRGVGHMPTMRKFFFDRFGAGQPEVLAERTRVYLLGMPGKDGEVFPPRCNMENKLDKLETEREFLLEMCPKDKRDKYEEGKEHTLVRIVLRNVPAEYDAAVKAVRDMMKLRKFGESGNFKGFTNKEDHTRVNYDTEWLPPYDELRVELVSSWQLQERRRKDLNKSIKKHPGFPTLPILPGHEQPGPHRRNCYSCGLLDHISGDPICNAGPNDVWKGAPAMWKAKMGRPKGKGGKGKGKGKGGKGKGKGKPYQRNLGDRKPADGEKANDGICHNYSRGNGYCKYGTNCNFKHEGPKGGKRKAEPSSSIVAAGSSKRAKKNKASLIMSDHKEVDKLSDSDDDEVYRLIRGAPTCVIKRSQAESEEYRPVWLKDQSRMNDGMGYDDAPSMECTRPTGRQCNFVVTLMMRNTKSGGEDYVPIRESPPPDSTTSESDPEGTTRPPPKFKIGDAVKFKRSAGDTRIHGTGCITRVSKQDGDDPDPTAGSSSVRTNCYAYEIDTVKLTEPGVEGYVGENLIRHLGFNEQLYSHRGPMSPVLGGKSESSMDPEKKGANKSKTQVLYATRDGKRVKMNFPHPANFAPLPDTWEEFQELSHNYLGHPIWDICSPKEYYQWNKDDEYDQWKRDEDEEYHQRLGEDMNREVTSGKQESKNRETAVPEVMFKNSKNRKDRKISKNRSDWPERVASSEKSPQGVGREARPEFPLPTNTRFNTIGHPDFSYGRASNRVAPGKGAAHLPRGGAPIQHSPSKEKNEAEGRLKRVKGVSLGPAKWYSTKEPGRVHNPQATHREKGKGDEGNKGESRKRKNVEPQRKRRNLREWLDVIDKDKECSSDEKERRTVSPRRKSRKKAKVMRIYKEGKYLPRDIFDPDYKYRYDEDIMMVIKIKKGEKMAYVDYVSHHDDSGFEGPCPLSTSIADLVRRKGYVNLESNIPSSSESESESEADSVSESSQGEDKEEDGSSDEEDHGGNDDGNCGIFTNLSPASPYNSEELAEQKEWGSRNEESATGERPGNPKEGHPLNRPAQHLNQASIVQSISKENEARLEGKLKPEFEIGQVVHYWDAIRKNYWVGVVRRVLPIERFRYAIEPEGETADKEPYVVIDEREVRKLGWALWRLRNNIAVPSTCLPINESPLLPLHCVGIDTCSALSVSSERNDFSFLDMSPEAKESVSLRGIGGEQSSVGGRGPMLISALDDNGRQIYLIDPAGVYLEQSASIKLRILGQQRMKSFGFNLVQNKDGDGRDFLVYRSVGTRNDNVTCIPLTTLEGILMLETTRLKFTAKQRELADHYINSLCDKGEGDHLFHFETPKDCPVLIMNEGTLTDQERNRLDHWRHAHRSATGRRHDERCPACEQAKHKTGSFKRNKEYLGTGIATLTVYWRLYCDGFGGQHSMGQESYQGAKGGFVFVCPVSGRMKVKLYATTKQYPAILYQILQEVESEGYAVREVYVDTHIVNISQAAEDVAAMFKVRIVPISSGTPQELAYAERAVQTLAQMSRALMAGAPHLPQFCWGCSDIYAAYLHMTIPQKSKEMKTPYEKTTGRVPNMEAMFIKVFGCACQYEPHNGAEHKRGSKTLWGWFLGIQWPMVLILRPSDNKIISVSRKKVHCHEQCYAKFDPTTQTRPLITFTDFSLIEEEIDNAVAEAKAMDKKTLKKFKEDNNIPKHVPSVKSLSDFNRNSYLNENPIESALPDNMIIDLPQESHRGEEEAGSETDLFGKRLNNDDLLEEIRVWKEQIAKGYDETWTDKIVKALRVVEEDLSNHAPKRGELKRKKRSTKTTKGVERENIIEEKRNEDSDQKTWTKNTRVRDLNLRIGDVVRIATHRFGREYARGLPKFTMGKVTSVSDESAKVKWQQGDTDTVSQLSLKLTGRREITLASSSSSYELPIWDDPRKRNPHECAEISMDACIEADKELFDKWEQDIINVPKKWSSDTILPIMEVGSCISGSEMGGSWPRDFYEALVRPDWRRWIEAVKDENESWNLFDACQEVSYDLIEKGASVIPLGELFTIKRNGKYKFRQIALGNLLKEGKDYAETFASTISGDGIRWFYAVASSCGRNIYGWDAKTGYLQTEQRIPIYAYLPSHYGYSNLTFEELAVLRAKMIRLLKTEGIDGVKRFSGKMRKERRIRPKTVLKLNRSIYGVPDAGQSFAMFMQSLHLKKCGMIQSELDPCIYYKIMQRDNADNTVDEPVLEEFLIAITWVDDVRYFGTDKLVRDYEKMIQLHCKCTLEGISNEFVSIEINHDVVGKTLEMKQEDYWVKAVERFRSYLGKDGPKVRLVPLSVADEKLLVEPTDAEIAEAQHLPFPSLLGVVQYPSCYTKVEMKYSMSVLSRWRTKWGTNHFKVLLKALEYGYATRKRGLKYNGNAGGKVDVNEMEGFADASLSVPRSQGGRSIRMNCAAITMTSKRHSTTDDSTTAAELTEAYLLACEIEGFRNLMSEVGLRQKGPTILYQDNKAAIQIAMNRGSLSRKTRGTDLRVLTLRNKVEDLKVVPVYLYTADMLIDLGTKSLDPKPFCRLCDMLCGYAERTTTVKLDTENYVDEENDKHVSWVKDLEQTMGK